MEGLQCKCNTSAKSVTPVHILVLFDLGFNSYIFIISLVKNYCFKTLVVWLVKLG